MMLWKKVLYHLYGTEFELVIPNNPDTEYNFSLCEHKIIQSVFKILYVLPAQLFGLGSSHPSIIVQCLMHGLHSNEIFISRIDIDHCYTCIYTVYTQGNIKITLMSRHIIFETPLRMVFHWKKPPNWCFYLRLHTSYEMWQYLRKL